MQMRFFKLSSSVLALSLVHFAHANSPTIEPRIVGEIEQTTTKLDDKKALKSLETNSKLTKTSEALQNTAAQEVLKEQSEAITIDANSTTEEIYAHLEADPAAFENLLLRSISSSNVEALRALLPAYERYPNKDQSVIDWGQALIALQEGRTKEAVAMYRKINAALPNIRLLRLQMASALYQNKQAKAAKSELEKLLREEMPESERQMLTNYIEMMKRQDKWNFGFNVSFLKDSNLEDAPPVGTKIGNEMASLSYDTPHESGTGVSYSMDADKRWSYDNKMFTSFSAGLGGSYYWDNKKFNDLYASTSAGVGYQTATGEIQISPTFSKSWYGGGVNGKEDDSLKSYTTSKGVRLSGHKWVTPNVMYQHSTQFTDLEYKEPYQHNDGKIYSMMNGALYAPNARKYYGVYWNLSKKDGVNDADSYERSGVNFSWNNTWDKGFTTLATLGIASKKYDGPNFANITRHNREYSAGLSLWKRDFSIFGLTPRLNINTKKVRSNYAFDETSETNANIVLTKTF